MLSLLCREAIYYISPFTSTLRLLLLTAIRASPQCCLRPSALLTRTVLATPRKRAQIAIVFK